MNRGRDRDYISQSQERVSDDIIRDDIIINDETIENTLHICCRCYWNDQCCEGCMVPQFKCDDFTPIAIGGRLDELDYIEKEYLDDMRERIDDYEDYMREMGAWDDCE